MSASGVVARWWRSPRVLALAVLAGGTWWLWAQELAPKALGPAAAPVPHRVGLWRGATLPVDARTKAILETDDVSLMEYRLGEEPPVWFTQVAGFGNRAAFHPPEICYVGSHYEVLERGPITVRINGSDRRVMRLVVGQGAERSEAWYWFTADARSTPNYYQQQAWLMLDAMRRRPGSGTLVRISTVLDDPVKCQRRLLAFLTSYEESVRPGNKELAKR